MDKQEIAHPEEAFSFLAVSRATFCRQYYPRLIMAVLGIFIRVAEEKMMRGFFMGQLHRGGITIRVQIIASGVCWAVYHSLHNLLLVRFLPSFILFASMAGLFVLGKRSITATATGRSLIHISGDHFLTMLILVTTL